MSNGSGGFAGLPGFGGAISQNAGTLEVYDSQFTGNSSSQGGAIEFDPDPELLPETNTTPLSILGTTFDSNRAILAGGAIDIEVDGLGALLINDTLTRNATGLQGDAGGGAIQYVNDGTSGALTLQDDTVNGNASWNGGGIYEHGGSIDIDNTIVAQNTAVSTGPDFAVDGGGTINDKGGNLLGSTAGTGGDFGPGTLIGNPSLGPLQDNGGYQAGTRRTARPSRPRRYSPGASASPRASLPAPLCSTSGGFPAP